MSEPSPVHGRASDILAFVGRVLGGTGHSRCSLGGVSRANVDLVQSQTGKDLSGFKRVLESSEVRHVLASHGNAARERARGQAAVKKSDLAKIDAIVEQAQTVRLIGTAGRRKPQRLEYTAFLDGCRYRYLEDIRPGAQVVALKTMWKGGARGA